MKKLIPLFLSVAFLLTAQTGFTADIPYYTTSKTLNHAMACVPVDWPITDPGKFVSQFEEAAYCHCAQSGFPYDYCKNTLKMRGIYLRMIDMYHSKENSCNVQKDIPVDLCIQEWNNYCGYRADVCRPK